jgi:hypothetical protein
MITATIKPNQHSVLKDLLAAMNEAPGVAYSNPLDLYDSLTGNPHAFN